jgi:UDP-glucose/GDP-mannose dehydrogenase family, NAD binding domain
MVSGGSMQIGVYGAGYLGTVVSACLADFGTPVICCHPDSSQMVAMAQGNVPFHEKNLTEVIKRNVRSGRLAYSTDIESFARKAQVIFLAEDSVQHLSDLAIRIARAAAKPPILTIVTPVPVGTASAIEQSIAAAGLRATLTAYVLYPGLRDRGFQLAGPHHSGNRVERCCARSQTNIPLAGDARRSGDCDQSRNRRTGARICDCVCGNQNFFHQRTGQFV